MKTEWWHISGWPSPEEWQVVSGFVTAIVALIGVAVALYQIRLGIGRLRLSALAADRAAAAEEAQSRPYLSVRFDLRVTANGDPKDPDGEGLLFIIVESIGRTPARDITLTVDPKFQTSGRGRVPRSGPDTAMAELETVFSGDFVISMLAPGQMLEYILDFTSEVFNGSLSLPIRYTVDAKYGDVDGKHTYEEDHVLDLSPWRYSIKSAKPIDVIARQLRRMNSNLEK